jgi:hypothetical protein
MAFVIVGCQSAAGATVSTANASMAAIQSTTVVGTPALHPARQLVAYDTSSGAFKAANRLAAPSTPDTTQPFVFALTPTNVMALSVSGMALFALGYLIVTFIRRRVKVA